MPGWRVHLAAGAGVGVVTWLASQEPIALPLSMGAAMIPDIDTPSSWISYKLHIGHGGSYKHIKHRGAWHYHVSAYAAALTVGIAAFFVLPHLHFILACSAATFLGWASHIWADRIETRVKRRGHGKRERGYPLSRYHRERALSAPQSPHDGPPMAAGPDRRGTFRPHVIDSEGDG